MPGFKVYGSIAAQDDSTEMHRLQVEKDITLSNNKAAIDVTGKLNLPESTVAHDITGSVDFKSVLDHSPSAPATSSIRIWKSNFQTEDANDTNRQNEHDAMAGAAVAGQPSMPASGGLKKYVDSQSGVTKFKFIQDLEQALNNRLSSAENNMSNQLNLEITKRIQSDSVNKANRFDQFKELGDQITEFVASQNAHHTELVRILREIDIRDDTIDSRLTSAIAAHNQAIDNIDPRLRRLESILMVNYATKEILIDPQFDLVAGQAPVAYLDNFKAQNTFNQSQNPPLPFEYLLNHDHATTYSDFGDPASWSSTLNHTVVNPSASVSDFDTSNLNDAVSTSLHTFNPLSTSVPDKIPTAGNPIVDSSSGTAVTIVHVDEPAAMPTTSATTITA